MHAEQISRIPVINLWDYLIVPLQGDVGDDQAARLTGDVLQRIREHSKAGLIVDLSGLWLVDSHLCAVLANLAASANLMGTPTWITGLSPEIALTLQAMDFDLTGMRTALSLEQALEASGGILRVRQDSDPEGPLTDAFSFKFEQEEYPSD